MKRMKNTQETLSPRLAQAVHASPLGGELLDCSGSVPLHEASIATFFGALRPGAIHYFVPAVPVASELGLPAYDPLLFWVPDGIAVSREALLARPFAPARLQRETGAPLRRIEGVSLEEQEHYFVDHYGAICPLPRQVSVVVANACNLSCLMCPYHGKESRRKHTRDYFATPRFMDRDVLFAVADQIGALGLPVKMGNIEEPLLHPDLAAFVARARGAGSPGAHVTTNGTMLTASRADALLDAGLTSLYVSIDAAMPETYARIRGGGLAKVEAHVRGFLEKAAKRSPRCTVMVSFVQNDGVDPQEVERFAEKWLPLTDGVIFYNVATYAGGSARFASIHDIAQRKVRDHGKRWPCLNPWQEVYLQPDGGVLYCCETLSRLAYMPLASMGNFLETPLPDIWLGETFGSLRRALLRNSLGAWPACDTCGIWMAHVSATEETEQGKVVRNMITEIRYPS